jgi:hypothetical protein
MVKKIFGVIFLLSAFGNIFRNFGYGIAFMIVGIVLLLWGNNDNKQPKNE